MADECDIGRFLRSRGVEASAVEALLENGVRILYVWGRMNISGVMLLHKSATYDHITQPG